jgi:hypothetical protein
MDTELRQQWCCDSGWGSSTSMAPSESSMASGESAIFDLLDHNDAFPSVPAIKIDLATRRPLTGRCRCSTGSAVTATRCTRTGIRCDGRVSVPDPARAPNGWHRAYDASVLTGSS